MKSGNLEQITVRFTSGAMKTIEAIAKDNYKSKAEVVRLAVDENLLKYLDNVTYIDREQGEEIRRLLFDLCNELQGIRNEVHRIGVNYNQEIRIKNIKDKMKGLSLYSEMSMKLSGEIKAIEGESEPFTVEKFKELYGHLDELLKKAGDDLCRIVG